MFFDNVVFEIEKYPRYQFMVADFLPSGKQNACQPFQQRKSNNA
jgi:hypothetical protein